LVKPKRKGGVLHHRVPDSQLVYCGPNKKLLGQVVRQIDMRTKLKPSVLADEKASAIKRLKQH
jgi:hypothetical protein